MAEMLESVNDCTTVIIWAGDKGVRWPIAGYLQRLCMNPGSFSRFVHSLVCQVTHSFLNGFQPNLYQHFSHVCSTCRTIFSLK